MFGTKDLGKIIEKAVSPYGTFIVGTLDCTRAGQAVFLSKSRAQAI